MNKITYIGDKKAIEAISYYEGEKAWRRQILESIEPGMTSTRADELKISQKINLLDETKQITVDGVPVGEPYPLPPGMIDQLLWGTRPPENPLPAQE